MSDPVSLWAAVAAFLAGSSVAVRARMLQPGLLAWTHAPRAVWASLSLLALALLMAAVSLFFGARATVREAMVYSVLAGVGLVMVWNLNRNGRLAEAERRRIAAEVQAVLEASGAPARYPGERAR